MLCWSLLGKETLAAAPVPHPVETWHRGGHVSWLPPRACHSNSDHFSERVGAFVCSCEGEHVPGQPRASSRAGGSQTPRARLGARPCRGQTPCILGSWAPNPPRGAEGAGITVFKYRALSAFPGNCCFHGKC